MTPAVRTLIAETEYHHLDANRPARIPARSAPGKPILRSMSHTLGAQFGVLRPATKSASQDDTNRTNPRIPTHVPLAILSLSPISSLQRIYARDNSATEFPRLILAALTVFAISIAIVSGPTPPGTGVMAPAISATSGCTSPTRTDPFARNVSSRLALA